MTCNIFLLVLPLLMLAGCQSKEHVMTPSASLTISSPAFAHGQPIPPQYTCQGEDISPPLIWSKIPDASQSLALIMDDPDAPVGTWVHWVLYNLPPTLNELPENAAASAQLQGTHGANSWKRNSYGGPCPPPGKPHRYFFKLYALDIPPSLPASLSAEQLYAKIQGHILASGEWMGTYKR